MTETRGRPAFSSFLLALSPRTSKNRDKLSSWKWSSGCSLPFHKGWEAAPWGPVSSRHSSLGSRGETRVLQQEFPGSALLWAASDERASGPSAHGCSVLTLASGLPLRSACFRLGSQWKEPFWDRMRREGQCLVQIVGSRSSQRGPSPRLLQKLLPPPEAKAPTGRPGQPGSSHVLTQAAGPAPGRSCRLGCAGPNCACRSVLGLLAHRQGEASFQTQDPSPLLCASAVWWSLWTPSQKNVFKCKKLSCIHRNIKDTS